MHAKTLKTAVLFVLMSVLMLFAGLARAQQYQDEFNTSTLGSSWSTRDGYAAQNPNDTPNHATFQMTGSQLSISIPGGAEHNMWTLRHAQASRPYLGSGVYDVKVDSPLTGDQQFGLVFQQDPSTFMLFMLYSYENVAVRAYVERFALVNGELVKKTFQGGDVPVAMPSAGPHYLRVVVTDNANPALRQWKFDWSPDGASWSELIAGVFETGLVGENAGTIQQFGLFAGNQPTGFHAHNAKFDYFRYYSSLATAPLSKPTGLVARAGDRRVDLSWNAVPYATSYAVYTATGSGSFSLVGITSQTSSARTGLTNGTTYRYRVAGIRNWSVGAAAETSAVPHVNSFAALPSQGLTLALSASELAYAQASGSAVTAWPNASGPSLAASSTGSLAPVLIHSAINGNAAVRFDGVDDHLTLPSGFQNFTAGMSLYVVMRPSTLNANFKLVALGNGAGLQNIGLGRASGSAGVQYFNTSSWGEFTWFNTPDALIAGETSLVSLHQDAGSADGFSYAEVAKNGVSLFGQQMFVPPVATRSTNYVAKSYWNEGTFHGDVAEIILYNRKLTSQENTTVQNYVATKYGLSMGGGTPALAAPTGVVATAGNATVGLSWSAVSGASSYRVYRSTTSSGPYSLVASPTGTSHSDTGLTNGTTYFYVVRAFNGSLESANSQQVSATPAAAALAAPTGVTATAGNGSVVLAWSAVGAASGYRVYRSTTSGGPYTLVASPTGTSHSDTSLTNGTTYFYVVRAFNSSVESANSEQVSATPAVALPQPDPALPAAGRLLVLDAQSAALQYANGATVTSWPDISGGTRHASAGGTSTPVLVTNVIGGKPALRFDGVDDHFTLPSGFQDFTAGMSLYVVMRPSVLTTGFKLVALGNGAGQQNIGLGRAADTAGYQYLNTNASGTFSWFNTATGLSAGEASLVSVHQDSGSAGGNSYAEINKNGALLLGQSVFVPPVATRSTNYIARSYWNDGLFQGDIAEIILYNRRLSAQENASVQNYLATKYGLSLEITALAAPTGVSASAGNGSVALSWSAVNGASSYRVYRSATSGGPYTLAASPAGTTHSDTGLTVGTTYFYVVRAFNGTVESANSAQVSATPAAALPEPNAALPAAGRLLVLDAQTAALQFANGTAVSSWQDISGGARHAVSSGSATPVLVTNAIGGMPALRFDGVDDHFTLPGGFQDFTAGLSLYVVMRPSTLTYGFKIVALGNGAGQQNIGLGRAGASEGFQYFNTNANGAYSWFDTPSGLVAGEASLVSVQQDGGTAGANSYAEATKNGAFLFGQQVFVPPVATRSVNYVGKSFWNEGMFQGDIAEIILYNRKLTGSEHAGIKSYIAGKYGLSVLP